MDFKQALEKRTPIFDSIIDIMKSGRNTPEETDGVYKFLIVVNQIIDYYLDRNDDTLKIPIVYFPMCDDISQELCEEFVALKFGFYSNSLWRENVVNSLKIITNYQ